MVGVPLRRNPLFKERLAGMARKEKTVKGWREVTETDKKLHGLKKNLNKFCRKCGSKEDCLKGRMAAIAYCEDINV